jgi:hypothetical protein
MRYSEKTQEEGTDTKKNSAEESSRILLRNLFNLKIEFLTKTVSTQLI